MLIPQAGSCLSPPCLSSTEPSINIDVSATTSINYQWCSQRESRRAPGSENNKIWLYPDKEEITHRF